MNQTNGGVQQDVPNATTTLVLGICSLVFCGLGPILGTIALVLAGKGKKNMMQTHQCTKKAL
ncbi:MAG: hypothetical protein IPG89_20100 [Bacteroidetes bacterium]|nr:hypothetical protein [Bacteroidota bacterium]